MNPPRSALGESKPFQVMLSVRRTTGTAPLVDGAKRNPTASSLTYLRRMRQSARRCERGLGTPRPGMGDDLYCGNRKPW